jgi:hypothetical protein
MQDDNEKLNAELTKVKIQNQTLSDDNANLKVGNALLFKLISSLSLLWFYST